MKPNEEIYCVIFNKIIIKDGLVSDSYTLSTPSIFGLPKSIILKGDKITVTFADESKHIIHYSENVELFYRPIETEKKENNKTKTRNK